MKIISIAHQKGGVGKTTLALNLAISFKKSGLDVALFDTDKQGSLSSIADLLDGISLIQNTTISTIKHLPYDMLIIDTPPYLINTLNELFEISDFVLVPTKTGFFDVMAIRATIALLKNAQIKRPHLKYGVLMNMVKPNTNITEDIFKILESYQTNVLTTRIHDRVSYTRSAISNGIFDTNDKKAQEEILNLTEEILTYF